MPEVQGRELDDIASRLEAMSRPEPGPTLDEPGADNDNKSEPELSGVDDPILPETNQEPIPKKIPRISETNFIKIPKKEEFIKPNIEPIPKVSKPLKKLSKLEQQLSEIGKKLRDTEFTNEEIAESKKAIKDALKKVEEEHKSSPQDEAKEALERGVRTAEDTGVRLSDVIGQPHAVDLARRLVAQINNPEAFEDWGVEPPEGLQLYGPPGTGKTLLAQAIAGETGSSFVLVKSSDVFGMWVGQSEKKAKAIFELAKRKAQETGTRSIIFFDEAEAVVPAHIAAGDPVGAKVRHEILQQMQGFAGRDSNIIVIAATNHPDMIDAAFRSRLTSWIPMELPQDEARAELFHTFIDSAIARIKVKKPDRQIGIEIDDATLIEATKGLSHRDIEQIVKEAIRIIAYQANEGRTSSMITTADIQAAIDATAKIIETKKETEETKRDLGFRRGASDNGK